MNETDESQKSIDQYYLQVLLHNSAAIRAEISHFTQRIDKIRAIYLSALFGLIGILLSPNFKPLKNIIGDIKADNTQVFLVLLLPIINSILLIYVASYMHFIYSAAKYNSFYIGDLLNEEVGRQIIPFDIWETIVGDKQAWITTRSIVGFMTFAIASLISIALLYTFSAAGRNTHGIMVFILYLVSLETVSLSVVVGAVNYYVGGKYHVSTISSKMPNLKRLYLFSIPLSVVLYIVLVWVA